MFGIFKKNKDNTSRKLIKSPNDLLVGDLVEFAFDDYQAIAGKTFNVDTMIEIDWGIGPNRLARISYMDDYYLLGRDLSDKNRRVILYKRVHRQEFDKCIDFNIFQHIFEKGYTPMVPVLETVPDEFKMFVEPNSYGENIDCKKASYKEDNKNIAEGFDLYELTGRTDKHFTMSIFVFDGRTEVYFARSFSKSIIENYWPAAGE